MNLEQLLKAFSEVLFIVFQEVVTIDDILNDKKKAALLASILAALDDLQAATEEVLPTELASAYMSGLNEAQTALQELLTSVPLSPMAKAIAAAVKIKPVIQNRIHLNALDEIVSDTMGDMAAAFRTAKESAVTTIDNTLETVRQEIASGIIQGEHSKVAAKRVAKEFAEAGMTSFITSDGRRLPLDFYARTVTRTKIRTAHVAGAETRYTDVGVGLVKITGSYPTCDVCARHRGLVVSLTGEHEGYPTKAQVPLPPFHPNDRCGVSPFIPEFGDDEEEAKERWRNFDPDEDTRTPAQRRAYEKEQEIRRVARQEAKAYEKMKAALGDKAPKTIGAYRRMKRKNDNKWQQLQREYLNAVRSI
ncbi:phage minor capsid protein [Bacillus sp. 37MA]|uniref:phage minor capsid protein n=1 Tax=Bacillus sp. 37MA TaxID=1132442 RepID=UPI0003671574|nr:phage minor capsid protein [Bacillus sp. 37MA]